VQNFQTAVELAHSGKLGKIHTLHASIYTPVLGNAWLPAQPAPKMEDCDWNMWLGPAPWRPFNQKYVDGGWRQQWDFDSGCALLDWGAHTLDLCQWANNSDDTMPVGYEPFDDKIVCKYANGVKLVLDFLKQPFGDRSPQYITRLGTCPVRFIGDEGSVETGDAGEIVVESKSVKLPETGALANGLDVTAHAQDFFNAIRSRGKPRANATVMRHSHIACHAAALSWVLGRKLKLDPKTETFTGDPEANLLRDRPSRQWAI
jgi:predicted dehydrogenase